MMRVNTWRCIDTGTGSAQWNMAVDEALLENFGEGDLPILRLYGWESALTAGRFSKLQRSVDLEKLKEQGLSCVRRMTGGGVLVHGGDLSYALIMPRDFLALGGVKESYRYLCRFLLRLYAKLGLQADFAQSVRHEGRGSEVCLAGNEAYDLLIEGSKMGGNAQRHTRKVLFQHGTIPMTLDTARFAPLFLSDSGLERAATLERLEKTIEYGSLAVLVQEAFCESFGVELVSDTLQAGEMASAQRLLACKYSQQRWNDDARHD